MPVSSLHYDHFSNFMSGELALWFYTAWPTILRVLTDRKYRKKSFWSDSSLNLLLYPPEHLIKENILNGRKPKNQSGTNRVKSDQPPPLEWLDGSLTLEDIDFLEHDATSVEHLASVLISLVSDGYGVSVKFDTVRERYNCTIYRPPTGKQRRHLGLSGNSPTVRDAVAVTLYRFEHKFGGVIDDASLDDAHAQQKRRFG